MDFVCMLRRTIPAKHAASGDQQPISVLGTTVGGSDTDFLLLME